MKRLFCCILVLVCCIASGCASAKNNNNLGSGTSNEFHIPPSEYVEFLSKSKERQPNNFVHLNQIPALGEFAHFRGSSDFSRYAYVFYDDQHHGLSVTVYHSNKEITDAKKEYGSVVSVSSEMETMLRRTPDENATRIEHGGAIYFYPKRGYLNFIMWEIDGITFKLDASLLEIVLKDCTNYNRLLSTDEAEVKAALEEFKQLLSTK